MTPRLLSFAWARGVRIVPLAALFFLGWLFLGCNTYADMLQRGQVYYQENEYERALAVWRELDADRSALRPAERARYYYLRGMTDFRLGYAPDARYWLGLAQASRTEHPSALDEDEIERLDETLASLSRKALGLEQEAEASGQVLGDKCAWTSECDTGFVCEAGVCVQAARQP